MTVDQMAMGECLMKDKVIVLSADGLGRGDERLGQLLMANFLRQLGELPEKPKALFLLNSGVKLVTEGSNALEHLERLQAAGVDILSCRTCIEWFDLEDKVRVGKISSMAAFIQLAADHEVITV